MYTVIELQGHQWIVKTGDTIEVDKVDANEGDVISTDKILLAFDENQENVKVGTPYIKGKVYLEVKSHLKGDKIYVRKFKNKIRASRNSKGRGFRAYKSKLLVKDITLS